MLCGRRGGSRRLARATTVSKLGCRERPRLAGRPAASGGCDRGQKLDDGVLRCTQPAAAACCRRPLPAVACPAAMACTGLILAVTHPMPAAWWLHLLVQLESLAEGEEHLLSTRTQGDGLARQHTRNCGCLCWPPPTVAAHPSAWSSPCWMRRSSSAACCTVVQPAIQRCMSWMRCCCARARRRCGSGRLAQNCSTYLRWASGE